MSASPLSLTTDRTRPATTIPEDEVSVEMLDCPSSDDLRLGLGFRDGGSGSSGLKVRQPARDGASGGGRGSVV